jgi:hypothetical protein
MEPTPTPITPSSSVGEAVRRFLSFALGLASVGALAMTIWPGLIRFLIPRDEPADTISTAPIRFAAFLTFGVAAGLRVLLSPGKQRTGTRVAWEAFANETGGSFTEEKLRPGAAGWVGGPGITWSERGGSLRLSRAIERGDAAVTQFVADRELPRGFQFQVCAQNFVTNALMSPKVWQIVLAGVKRAGGEVGDAGARERLVGQLSFLAGKDVALGDPEFDGAFILKTDDEGKAREFFADAGVRHWLRELSRSSKGWMFTLLTGGGSDPFHLTLQGPGAVREAEALKAAHSLMVAALERLESLAGAPHEARRAAS